MCGIVGWSLAPGVRRPVAQLHAMLEAIGHRGPDDRGELEIPGTGVTCAFARLSILDLSKRGHQPMVTEDGRVALLVNGELYNFRALRTELESCGDSFRSSSDAEVMLRAFARWGAGALDRFQGMFACAVWLASEQSLLLARDPLGMKPLYYTRLPGGEGIAFASEVKAFVDLPGIDLDLDRTSLRQYLEVGYTYREGATIFAGVEKVQPGSYLVVRDGRIERSGTFFAPTPRGAALHNGAWGAEEMSEAVDRLHGTLQGVVEEHLVADVPVALLLSGGVDSSLLAALGSRSKRLTTIAMRFAQSAIDETAQARQVADILGTDHHEVVLSPEETLSDLADSCRYFDDLFADWGLISTRSLYKRCRDEGVKVVLVGEGADELFGGYPVFGRVPARGRGGPMSWEIHRLYRIYSGQRFGGQFRLFRRTFADLLARCDGDLFQAVRLFEIRHQLPNNYVMKVDRASMSLGIEARTPYLDRRVAEVALSLPREALVGRENKHILREVIRRFTPLPEEVAGRRKFGAAIATGWLEDSPGFRVFARDRVLRRGGWAEELGMRDAMVDYFDHGLTGYSPPSRWSIFGHLAWRLLLLDLWAPHYLRRAAAHPMSAPILSSGAFAARCDIEPGLVSVIIPVHNRARLVGEAVASAVSQSYRPIEILVVDDGSTDDTPPMLAALAAAHAEVKVLRQANGGPGAAREHGRRAARGEFVQYLDSDDLLLPGKLERQVAGLRAHPECGASYGWTRFRAADGTLDPHPCKGTGATVSTMFPELLRWRWWHTGTALYRASVCDIAGPWTALHQEEDWEYDCRIAAQGVRLHYVPEWVCEIRDHDGDRLCRSGAVDPRLLASRAEAHARILSHARAAGIGFDAPEMRHFARELFLLSRQCGAQGLGREARRLHRLALSASEAGLRPRWDLWVYGAAASLLGWGPMGRLARAADRLRPERDRAPGDLQVAALPAGGPR